MLRHISEWLWGRPAQEVVLISAASPNPAIGYQPPMMGGQVIQVPNPPESLDIEPKLINKMAKAKKLKVRKAKALHGKVSIVLPDGIRPTLPPMANLGNLLKMENGDRHL